MKELLHDRPTAYLEEMADFVRGNNLWQYICSNSGNAVELSMLPYYW